MFYTLAAIVAVAGDGGVVLKSLITVDMRCGDGERPRVIEIPIGLFQTGLQPRLKELNYRTEAVATWP